LTATGGINGTFNPDIVGVKNKVELFYDANHVYLCDHCKFGDFFATQLPVFPGGAPAEVLEIAGARSMRQSMPTSRCRRGSRTYWAWRCSRSSGRSL